MITVKLTFKDFCISIGIILIIFVMLLEIVLSYDKWDYHNEMWTLLLSFIPFSLIFIVGITFKGVKILHPYLMVSILYFFLFILSPIKLDIPLLDINIPAFLASLRFSETSS